MVDDGTGQGTFKIAGLTITSPGVYTTAPTGVSLTGGGSATPATFGAVSTAAHVSGALTKSGLGTLTLTASNTYAGDTTVDGGILVADTAATLGAGNLSIAADATCTLRNPSGAVADGASVHLTGSGKIELAAGVNETVSKLYIDGVLQAAGTWNAARDPLHFSGSGNLIVTQGAVLLTPAETWRQSHFGTVANSGDAADDADRDHDGVANLVERALGSDPRAGDSLGAPGITQGGTGFSFTFNRSRAATDLTVVVQVSPDLALQSWRDVTAEDGQVELVDDSDPELQGFRFTAVPGGSRGFYRVSVR
jgi:autotransporter-associated beta strand protein